MIFRDTLRRDFGHDADLLRDQVTRTVRHELAHHVGFDELGVASRRPWTLDQLVPGTQTKEKSHRCPKQ